MGFESTHDSFKCHAVKGVSRLYCARRIVLHGAILHPSSATGSAMQMAVLYFARSSRRYSDPECLKCPLFFWNPALGHARMNLKDRYREYALTCSIAATDSHRWQIQLIMADMEYSPANECYFPLLPIAYRA